MRRGLGSTRGSRRSRRGSSSKTRTSTPRPNGCGSKRRKMQPADRKKFIEVLTGLAAMKPGGKLTPESIELFWNAMQDWALEDFVAAANHLARSHEFMPNPYHFEQLRRAGELT